MRLQGTLRHATEYIGFKIFITICIILLTAQLYIIAHPHVYEPNRTFSNPERPYVPSNLISYGGTQCIPEVGHQMIAESIEKHSLCRSHSPFATGRARIGVVTALFGDLQEHYQKAFQTHMLHSLIHGTIVHVLCDSIVDDLWNKPAFLLNLLMHEMLRPAKERLEWIMWVDRDTLILDQCHPILGFLPPESSRFGGWWERSTNLNRREKNATHLLVTNDFNGLNNGVFLLRVNSWAIELFNSILAFRHYNPGVELKFTEQSAMELVINEDGFKEHTQFVPQHWFNGYPEGGARKFRDRTDENGLDEEHVRRGDYLVHFAGKPKRDEIMTDWLNMVEELPDVWEYSIVQRDISTDVLRFWRGLGY
ncbi:hypothetical protein HBH98_015310 [Parastagonospora nodorum]|nr:hypothetical protein HBH50_112960 [Parastagonospora nodorum]KAH4088493.1 hypothetical protein HBH48_129930 [Parastagonospora nodorum]KAH4103727.1 hypothetical protein HBH46_108770 [Parastagonospora nodorum]KAH4185846.1 hypothetical protein HBI95_242350 [Parastagonospora nodorum]KAH4354144.1 hypothetical protein HBH98_015310 [Parastagonospora nodorum]